MIEFNFMESMQFDVDFESDSEMDCSFDSGDAFVCEFDRDIDPNEYMGSYEVTPSAETQALVTVNKILTRNVIVNPIPSNYGLITWDGSTITVS